MLLASDGQAAEAIAAVVCKSLLTVRKAGGAATWPREWTGFEGRNPAFARQAVEP